MDFALKAKDKHRRKIIEFIGNPENDIPTRRAMADEVCKIRVRTLYDYFTPDELSGIEKEGLALRRTKYAPHLARADRALFKLATEGDVAAIKLAYQRFEGWSEKQVNEYLGQLELKHKHALDPMDIKKFHRVILDATRSRTPK